MRSCLGMYFTLPAAHNWQKCGCLSQASVLCLHKSESHIPTVTGTHLILILQYPRVQAQRLASVMGGADTLMQAVTTTGVVLAAHGPYTARGAGSVLGCSVACVSENFATFAGLITALEDVCLITSCSKHMKLFRGSEAVHISVTKFACEDLEVS